MNMTKVSLQVTEQDWDEAKAETANSTSRARSCVVARVASRAKPGLRAIVGTRHIRWENANGFYVGDYEVLSESASALVRDFDNVHFDAANVKPKFPVTIEVTVPCD